MSGRHHRPPLLIRWRTHVSIAATTLGLVGTGVGLASAYADTIDIPTDQIPRPPTQVTQTADAVRGPAGRLHIPTIGPTSGAWDPSKGELFPDTASYVPPVQVDQPTPEPAAPVTTEPEPATSPAVTSSAPTSSSSPATSSSTATTTVETTTETSTSPTTSSSPTSTTVELPTDEPEDDD